jgi:hypothetical protein
MVIATWLNLFIKESPHIKVLPKERSVHVSAENILFEETTPSAEKNPFELTDHRTKKRNGSIVSQKVKRIEKKDTTQHIKPRLRLYLHEQKKEICIR